MTNHPNRGKCPAYGLYDPAGNPFGVGFYHGWTSGQCASSRQVLERYPDLANDDNWLTLYLNGRDDGVKHDTFRLAS